MRSTLAQFLSSFLLRSSVLEGTETEEHGFGRRVGEECGRWSRIQVVNGEWMLWKEGYDIELLFLPQTTVGCGRCGSNASVGTRNIWHI